MNLRQVQQSLSEWRGVVQCGKDMQGAAASSGLRLGLLPVLSWGLLREGPQHPEVHGVRRITCVVPGPS